MFELPEYISLANQINDTLTGKKITRGVLGNSPHKFVWYNRTHEEFEKLTRGKTLGKANVKGRWLFVPVEPGYILVLGECGGKMLFHKAGTMIPGKYHLILSFDDGSGFSVTTQMWGAMELYKQGEEQKRQYIKDMRITPVEKTFTAAYFESLIKEVIKKEKKSVKGILTQDQIIPGLGNAIAQDIMFKARLHPRYSLADLDKKQKTALYQSIKDTVREVIKKGGRYDEYDLFNRKGKYIRLMDKNTMGKPCPQCGTKIEKIQYLGGACYFCPACQKI
ncbi:MAG: hypothetical protein JW969_20015 [Spirochaetales bacterium]|nr:hypothetical protein [Spirochaetales bacterium]